MTEKDLFNTPPEREKQPTEREKQLADAPPADAVERIKGAVNEQQDDDE
jgi:hypothetical protein